MLSLEELVNDKALRIFFSTASLDEIHVQALIAYVQVRLAIAASRLRRSSRDALKRCGKRSRSADAWAVTTFSAARSSFDEVGKAVIVDSDASRNWQSHR